MSPATSPTLLQQFISSPLTFSARKLYVKLTEATGGYSAPEKPENSIRFVCLSDIHMAHDTLGELPEGDVLVIAGDMTDKGTFEECDAVLRWANSQKHEHKIVVAGNHDRAFVPLDQRNELVSRYPGITFLQDKSASITVRGRTLRFYGNAQTPRAGSPAFVYKPIPPAEANKGATTIWGNIPDNTDVLVTHCPPALHRDMLFGCPGLLRALWRVRPMLHIFGHIHEGRGIERLRWTPAQDAYERICLGAGSWVDLLTIAKELATVAVGGRPASAARETVTVLANVASGDPRYEQVRGPTVIDM